MKTNLKELRKAAGWKNADDFARSIGMPPKTYRNYEQGVRMMGLDVASELCNALDCEINDLVSDVHYSIVGIDDDKLRDEDERKLVGYFRNMDESNRATLLETARAFSALSEKDGQVVERAERPRTVDAVIDLD